MLKRGASPQLFIDSAALAPLRFWSVDERCNGSRTESKTSVYEAHIGKVSIVGEAEHDARGGHCAQDKGLDSGDVHS